MKGMAQRAALQAQNEYLAQQVTLQQKHQATMDTQQGKLRQMQLDILEHVEVIQDLLNRQQTSDALQYTRDLAPAYERTGSTGLCENPIVDALLLGKLEDAGRQETQVTVDIHIPIRVGIQNVDLVGAFANLFDNALEACRLLPAASRWIRAEAKIRAEHLLIELQNPLPDAQAASPQKNSDRGLGMYILQDIAARYHGEFFHEEKDGRFIAKLVLQLAAEVQAQ